MHRARENKDIGKEIDCFTKMYNKIGEHVYGDVYMRQKEKKAKIPNPLYPHPYIKGGSNRIHAELSRYIALHLSSLYEKNAHIASQYGQNPYEWQSRAKDWQQTANVEYQKITLSIQRSAYQNSKDNNPFECDPFEIGGLYGPETVQKIQENQILPEDKLKEKADIEENIPSTPGTYNGMPSIFSQQVLDLMAQKHIRD